MQADEEIGPEDAAKARAVWLSARDAMVDHARQLGDLKVHKQIANRLLEPFLWHTVLITSTQWENFLNLRDHPDAQPEIQVVAKMMRIALMDSEPTVLDSGDWHLPFVTQEEMESILLEDLRWISVGRCARLSYLTHHGVRDVQADIDLAFNLRSNGHMSPFEHQAQALADGSQVWYGNLRGWRQFRKTLAGESVFRGVR
jgi:hypothetical protein